MEKDGIITPTIKEINTHLNILMHLQLEKITLVHTYVTRDRLIPNNPKRTAPLQV